MLRSGSLVLQTVDAQQVWSFPHIAREFPADLVERIRHLLRGAERLHKVMEELPRVLCHSTLTAAT